MKLVLISFLLLHTTISYAGVLSCEDYGRSADECYSTLSSFDYFISGTLLFLFAAFVFFKFLSSQSFRKSFIAIVSFIVCAFGAAIFIEKNYGKWVAIPLLLLLVIKMDWVLSHWYKLFGAFENEEIPSEQKSKITTSSSEPAPKTTPAPAPKTAPVPISTPIETQETLSRPAFSPPEKPAKGTLSNETDLVNCVSCGFASKSTDWLISSVGGDFKKCPRCQSHSQIEIPKNTAPNKTAHANSPCLIDDIIYCEKCGYFNQRIFFRPPYSRRDLKDFLYCYACENKITPSESVKKVSPELLKIIDNLSIKAYGTYYQQYVDQCNIFNGLSPEQTFVVVNCFNSAVNWLVDKGHGKTIVAYGDDKFQETLNDMDSIYGANPLEKIGVNLVKLTLCLWKYCSRLDLGQIWVNWESLVDLEGCTIGESKVALVVDKRGSSSESAACWPFPSGSRP